MSSKWVSHRDDSGSEYFYNIETNESAWEIPEGGILVEDDTWADELKCSINSSSKLSEVSECNIETDSTSKLKTENVTENNGINLFMSSKELQANTERVSEGADGDHIEDDELFNVNTDVDVELHSNPSIRDSDIGFGELGQSNSCFPGEEDECANDAATKVPASGIVTTEDDMFQNLEEPDTLEANNNVMVPNSVEITNSDSPQPNSSIIELGTTTSVDSSKHLHKPIGESEVLSTSANLNSEEKYVVEHSERIPHGNGDASELLETVENVELMAESDVTSNEQGVTTGGDLAPCDPTSVERSDTMSAKQNDTTPVKQSDTTPVKQSDTTPAKQSDTTPVKQSDTTPVKQRDTTPVIQTDTTPVKQSDTNTTPAKQSDTTPAKQIDTTPAKQIDTTPVKQSETQSITDNNTISLNEEYKKSNESDLIREIEANPAESKSKHKGSAVESLESAYSSSQHTDLGPHENRTVNSKEVNSGAHNLNDEVDEMTRKAMLIQSAFRRKHARRTTRIRRATVRVESISMFDAGKILESCSWWELTDYTTGYPYYVNSKTQEISWTKPQTTKIVALSEDAMPDLCLELKEQARRQRIQEAKARKQNRREKKARLFIARRSDILAQSDKQTEAIAVSETSKEESPKVPVLPRRKCRFWPKSVLTNSISKTQMSSWQEVYNNAVALEREKELKFKNDVAQLRESNLHRRENYKQTQSFRTIPTYQNVTDIWDLAKSGWTTYPQMVEALKSKGATRAKKGKMIPKNVMKGMSYHTNCIDQKPEEAAKKVRKIASERYQNKDSSRYSVLASPNEAEPFEVDQYNEHGETLLLLASGAGNSETVRALLDFGASVTKRDGTQRNATALHEACGSLAGCRQEVVENLLKAKGAQAAMLMTDSHGDTPLHCCARTGMRSVCETILRAFPGPATASMSVRNGKGRTPSELAKCGKKKHVEQLLAHFLRLSGELGNKTALTPTTSAS